MSVHEVARGDSLWKIAKDFAKQSGQGTSPREINEIIAKIKEVNGLDGDVIHPGQNLYLPEREAANAPAYIQDTPPAPVPKTPVEPASPQNALDSHEPRDVQRVLVDLGFDLGRYGSNRDGVDNHWGRLSHQATAQWQERNGYEGDGKLTLSQFEKLKTQAAELKTQSAVDQSLPTSLDGETVRRAVLERVQQYVGVMEMGGIIAAPWLENSCVLTNTLLPLAAMRHLKDHLGVRVWSATLWLKRFPMPLITQF